jgi:phage shock protein A
MGVLKRVKRIISANIHHLIESAEEPEAAIEQLLTEMDEGIMNLRKEAARAIAVEKRLARRIEEMRARIQGLNEDSERAVKESNDDLARKLIAERFDEQRVLDELEVQHEKASTVSDAMKVELSSLEKKMEDARRQKETLTARKRSAEAEKSSLSGHQRFVGHPESAASLLARTQTETFSEIEVLEDEVLEMEDETEALREVMKTNPTTEQTLEDAAREEDIDRVLKEIRERLKR